MTTLKQTFTPDPPKGVPGVSVSDHVWKSASPCAHVLCPTSPCPLPKKSRGHCPYLGQLSPGTGEAMLRPHSWRPSLFLWMPGDTGSLYHCSSICWTSGVLQRPSALFLLAPFMCLSVAGSAWKERVSWEAWPGWFEGEEMWASLGWRWRKRDESDI